MAHAVLAHANTSSASSASPLLSRVDSAGTAAYHVGNPPDPRTLDVLNRHDVPFVHAARKVSVQDFADFDLILGMDADNVEDLRRVRARAAKQAGAAGAEGEGDGLARVMLFGDFGGRAGEEINDPYYGGGEGFETAFEQATRFSRGLLAWAEQGRTADGQS